MSLSRTGVGLQKNRPHSGASELRAAQKASRHFLFAVFAFSIFVNFLMLTGPLFMLQICDRIMGSGSEDTQVTCFLLGGGL